MSHGDWRNPLGLHGDQLARFKDGTLCVARIGGDCFYRGNPILLSGLVDRTTEHHGYVKDWSTEDIPEGHLETRFVP